MPNHLALAKLSLVAALCCAPAAWAGNSEARDQLTAGYQACLSGGGQVDLTQNMLAALGWETQEGSEDGLISFLPPSGEDSFVYMADDGSFCHVESTTIDSATASEILAQAVSPPEGAPFDYSKDEMGCTRLDFETGVTATITSGGQDPTCGSDTDSGVRFDFSGANE